MNSSYSIPISHRYTLTKTPRYSQTITTPKSSHKKPISNVLLNKQLENYQRSFSKNFPKFKIQTKNSNVDSVLYI